MNDVARMIFLSGALVMASVSATGTLVTKVKLSVRRDAQLASDISESRESIWNNLSDRRKFARHGMDQTAATASTSGIIAPR